MSDLDEMIQQKKDFKGYFSLQVGLDTEEKCFEAIEMLGAKKFQLKEAINNMIKANVDPNSDKMKSTIAEVQEIHYIQSTIVNDVCARFEVIHPQLKEELITDDLLSKKQKYWDWYKEQYKKAKGFYPETL